MVIGKRGHSSFQAGHGWSAHRFDEHVLPFAFVDINYLLRSVVRGGVRRSKSLIDD